MVIGVIGPRGHLAIQLVVLVQDIEQDDATPLFQHLVDHRVLGTQGNPKRVLEVLVQVCFYHIYILSTFYIGE